MLADLDDPQPAPQEFPVIRHRRGPRGAVRGYWIGANDVISEQAQPAANGRHPTGVHVGTPVLGDEIDDPGDIPGGRVMSDRLVR